MKKKTVLVDCDGVLTNSFVGAAIDFAQANGVPDAKYEDIVDFDIFANWKRTDLWKSFTDEVVSKKGFVYAFDAEPRAKEQVELLREYCDVVCVTSPFTTTYWKTERDEWLRDRFNFDPKHNIISTKDKWRLRGELLIDDCAENCHVFAKEDDDYNFPRKTLTPKHPWNWMAYKRCEQHQFAIHALAVLGGL